MSKISRNDPCFCGSGKKFKKCCENKFLQGKFRIELKKESTPVVKSGLFQRVVSQSFSEKKEES